MSVDLKKLVGVLCCSWLQITTAMMHALPVSRMPRYYYVQSLILSLLLTGCQGASPTTNHEATTNHEGGLQAREIEFTSLSNYRITKPITIIDFKEVYLGTNATSVPVTWEMDHKSATIKAITFSGQSTKAFAAELIRSSEKKKAYSHVFFLFSPSKAGEFEAFAKPRLVDDVLAEGIKLRGMGVAVINQGNLMSYDIPDSLKKGLDFGRIPVGTLSQRKFQMKNLDTLHPVDISEVIVSSDFEVKTVKLSTLVIHQGPVRSFSIPKGATAEVTVEFKPPAGFNDNEKLFTGSIEFRSRAGTSRTGASLCGIAFHLPDVESIHGCYK